ncbi:hypothetical protein BHE90_008669 [Fusarium euwallaceae]|uniref:Uncharacterized protein n=2 Tax=Fusarium solani species complex TaxID=232080 RepID=A0A428UK03_9HYPO|nr:hypothetical protein CEP52_001169 [Fusarium oligoseptatum]RTE76860.1 hypothetical protein BHE90_008669 [Fusarium euwallaceae]
MHFSKLILAVLPALALAEDTTTQTSTAVLTKTYFLSQIHTVTATGYSTEAQPETTQAETTSEVETVAETTSTPVIESTSFVSVVNATSHEATPKSTIASTGSGTTGGSGKPTEVPENAASVAQVGKMALAGVAGMVVVALL